jgi:hypothetical protein
VASPSSAVLDVTGAEPGLLGEFQYGRLGLPSGVTEIAPF